MLNTVDLYLGTFLVLSGFALSLLNLRRLVKQSDTSYSTVLISENILLMCVGIAFVSRSVFQMNAVNLNMEELEERSTLVEKMSKHDHNLMDCNFKTVLMSYGPLIVSLINSFLTLVIDNYMHYRMLEKMKQNDEENTVQEIGERSARKIQVKKLYKFWEKYFSFITVMIQWVVPIIMVMSMYPVGVIEKNILMSDFRNYNDNCMAMLDIHNETCFLDTDISNSSDIRKYISSPTNYLDVLENDPKTKSDRVDSILSNIYKIISDLNNTSHITNTTEMALYQFREAKNKDQCLKMCFIDNKSLLVYIFILAVVCYFIPITISTMILTKIHIMDVKRPNVKTYVSRELLYNILFWTPVMFDTFVSLILCSYTMNGTRTSLFNVVANVYQAVKNFMNTKYFKNNIVAPV